MASKLPQFEFEKNAENDDLDEEQPAILTAAQIKPFEINRNDTSIDSFSEDFKLEPEAVLANFKKFLLSLRWTNNHPKNFKEWFLSIVDDCFYYYLKLNEPVYAYHLLKISRSFMQNFLYKLSKAAKIDSKDLEEDANFDPTNYTLEQCLGNLDKSANASNSYYRCHKLDYNFESEEWQNKEFDNQNINIEGNQQVSFHKNYALLVYYGLIQFRNYQANNFNILFLAFSCNVLKKHFSPLGSAHIFKIVDLVWKNYESKEKSDEYEMFLGKSGKNKFETNDDLIEQYSHFINPFPPSHKVREALHGDNLENYFATCLEFLDEHYSKVLTNLSLLQNIGEVARCIGFLNQNRIKESFMVITNLYEKLEENGQDNSYLDYITATCLSCIGDTLVSSKGNFDLYGSQTTSFIDIFIQYPYDGMRHNKGNFSIKLAVI